MLINMTTNWPAMSVLTTYVTKLGRYDQCRKHNKYYDIESLAYDVDASQCRSDDIRCRGIPMSMTSTSLTMLRCRIIWPMSVDHIADDVERYDRCRRNITRFLTIRPTLCYIAWYVCRFWSTSFRKNIVISTFLKIYLPKSDYITQNHHRYLWVCT